MSAPELAAIGYDQFVADVQALAAALEAEAWRPDHLVGIGRGGLVPGTYLSHRTGIPLLTIDQGASVAELAAATRAGWRLLLVDDINDTGLTVATLRRRLTQAGVAGEAVRFAVLIDNVGSSERVAYRARTIDRAVDKRWFVFPWEAMADRGALLADAAAVPARIA